MAPQDFSDIGDWLHVDNLHEDFSTEEETTGEEEATNRLSELYDHPEVPHPPQPLANDNSNTVPPASYDFPVDEALALPFLPSAHTYAEVSAPAPPDEPSQPAGIFPTWYPEGDIGRIMAMYDAVTAGRRQRALQRRSHRVVQTVDNEPGSSTTLPAPSSVSTDAEEAHAPTQETPTTSTPHLVEHIDADGADKENSPFVPPTVLHPDPHADDLDDHRRNPSTSRERKHSRATPNPVAGPSTAVPQDYSTDEEDGEPAPKRARTAQRTRRTRQELEEDQREDHEAQECGVDGCHWVLTGTSPAAQRQHLRQAHYPSETASETESTASSSSGCFADTEDTNEDESARHALAARPLRCRHIDCDKGHLDYKRRQDLIRHIGSAHWRPGFVCKCGKVFRRRSVLIRHTKGCDGKGEKKKPQKGKKPDKRK